MKTSPRARQAVRVHLRIATCSNLLMRETRKRVAERWNLTLPQFDVLAELARGDSRGFTFAELSRLLVVTSGNLTGIADRLERLKLVRRVKDPADRRVIRVALTGRGRAKTRAILPAHARDIEAIVSFLPRPALDRLCTLLGELRDGLHARAAPGGGRQALVAARRR